MNPAVTVIIAAVLSALAALGASEITARRTLAAVEKQNQHAERLQQAQFAENARIAVEHRRRALCTRLYLWAGAWEATEQRRTYLLESETEEQREAQIAQTLQPLMQRQAEIIKSAELEFDDLAIIEDYREVQRRYQTHLTGFNQNRQTPGTYMTWREDREALHDAVIRIRVLD